MKKIAVLMGGGKGTRFWPMSVKRRPKQFLKIFSEKTMLQKSAERLIPVVGEENIWVVTVKGMAEEVKKQLPFIEDRIIEEPAGKNTAAAVILSMAVLNREFHDFVVSFLPADHHIEGEDIFVDQLKAVFEVAENEVVTIGIPPTRPETGYGYIKFNSSTEKSIHGFKFYEAWGFVEKPSEEKAKRMLEEGGYFWNSGMFFWDKNIFLERLEKYSPEFFEFYKAVSAGKVEKAYKSVEPLPIDKAFMEKLPPGFVVTRAEFGWSDLGSWLSLWEVLKKDEGLNAAKGEVYFHNSRGNLVVSNKRAIIIGAEDLAIVETEHGLLVMKKSASSDLKKILEKLESE